jgi:hypothetical protein
MSTRRQYVWGRGLVGTRRVIRLDVLHGASLYLLISATGSTTALVSSVHID